MNSVNKLLESVWLHEWDWYKKRKRRRLKNTDFTIISSNCVGTIIYHDMGLPFLTPTINLTISMRDLVKMAGNLRWYMDQELVEVRTGGVCPAGLLGDIQVNFVHYGTFAEGAERWERRKKRIHWDNIFLMGTERDDCDYGVLQAFDRLPYPNKIVFTHVEYPEFSSAVCIHGFENQGEIGTITNFRTLSAYKRRRYIDSFDYITFLNNAKEIPDGTT